MPIIEINPKKGSSNTSKNLFMKHSKSTQGNIESKAFELINNGEVVVGRR